MGKRSKKRQQKTREESRLLSLLRGDSNDIKQIMDAYAAFRGKDEFLSITNLRLLIEHLEEFNCSK